MLINKGEELEGIFVADDIKPGETRKSQLSSMLMSHGKPKSP